MKEKKVDILLSKADLFKLVSIGSGGVFLLEIIKDSNDPVVLWGSFVVFAISGIVLTVLWDSAQKLTENDD